jgi:hypothetical protein
MNLLFLYSVHAKLEYFNSLIFFISVCGMDMHMLGFSVITFKHIELFLRNNIMKWIFLSFFFCEVVSKKPTTSKRIKELRYSY